MERMKELINILNNASRSYYQKNESLVSDFEYDKLYDELMKIEKDTGVILANSPTQNVGYTVLSNLTKVKHDEKILSLDKTKEPEKLKSWLENQEGVLSWKLDGLTIVLKYNNGELVQAITRGNGEVGEDITHNAKVFKNIPLKISYKDELIVRGEGIISYSDFERINEELDENESYKNPRNLCSGTVRQLNSEITSKRNVMFYAFTVFKAFGVDFDDKKSNQLLWLKTLGFDVVYNKIVNSDNIIDSVYEFENKIPENDFASDGLVLTYNSISYSSSLGTTAKFPKDSIAFKWKDETAETILREIEWNTSRTGLINPIAVFDSVELEGTTVNRASVHNVSILEDLKLGIGDTIKVYKANMIIPQIAENITKSGNCEIPKNCPVCNGETEIRSIRDGKALYCTNPNCSAQRIRSLSHFVSRDAMNIEGLSEETIKKFVEKGFISDYTDIYSLYKYADDIKNMEGFGEKSYNNLIESIEKSKNTELPNFIYALGINHVGLSNAKLLCKNINYDINKIFEVSQDELINIDGFGDIIAHSIVSYFADNKNRELLNKILKIVSFNTVEISEETENSNINGKTFVITGDLNNFTNRKELQNKIESLGGKVTGSVTKKTNYLINNDILSESSKNKKAKELGIPIITEEDFIKEFLNQ
ncbi:DNA ligase (NAD(+)) LigA [Tyzzerella sp. An114]|nr:NAD-dependent DNA ligase LigA [Tyzzerella sp. An114]OUQ59569.1 DNA ligase (NAD(+)) LigA [Tyzzerella sp. An114]